MKKILKLLTWVFLTRLKMINRLKLRASIFSFVSKSDIGKYCGIEKGVSIHNSKIGDYTYLNKFTSVENSNDQE